MSGSVVDPAPGAAPDPATAPTPARPVEYLVVVLLAVVGIVVLVDASRLGAGTTAVDPLGPRFVPLVVGIALLVVAVAIAVLLFRGRLTPDEEGGEDVDLSIPVDWRRVLVLLGLLVATVAVVDLLGWPITGALLFYLSALVLGSHHYLRALLVSVVLGVVSFYGFAVGLGVTLPAGLLQGIL